MMFLGCGALSFLRAKHIFSILRPRLSTNLLKPKIYGNVWGYGLDTRLRIKFSVARFKGETSSVYSMWEAALKKH